MIKDALFSPNKKYRYLLRRIWKKNLPRVTLIMLNPSTADAEQDDATIRKCTNIVTNLGYGGMYVVNLYPLVSTDSSNEKIFKLTPYLMKKNLGHMEFAFNQSEAVICAWSSKAPENVAYKILIESKMVRHGLIAWCFKITKSGNPMHPLYLRNDAQLLPYVFE